ncbi:polygalacturonase [Rhizoctonia solani]|uniref:endo-polygalacturonase n=1 Tax=Rhizoctonia solani TaxID=456999 RepID=A0A8H8P4I4_9AGAM|nr:polygalacturonase [Rhizoctonia solani]QRW25501.1 polygalacturonase [Rhizoctonia solani]
MITTFSILALVTSALGNPVSTRNVLETRDTCTINSLSTVTAAEKCSTCLRITIDAFTVPAGQKLVISALNKATINMNGNITPSTIPTFAADTTFKTSGPLFTLSITFNGNGFTIDGQALSHDQVSDITSEIFETKLKWKYNRLSCSGTVKDIKVLNSPAQVFSMGNDATLIVSNIDINNSAANAPNSLSGGKPAAHNTDGFDGSTINKDSNIAFLNNKCTGGHGISIGSIASGSNVSNIRITGNTITNNVQALRIKTDANAKSGSVSGVTYSGNHATGCTSYGVIIDQSYPDTLGTAGAGVKISDITFSGTNNIAINPSAKGEIEVNCAKGSCSGTWDWSGLKVSGGPSGSIVDADIPQFKSISRNS